MTPHRQKLIEQVSTRRAHRRGLETGRCRTKTHRVRLCGQEIHGTTVDARLLRVVLGLVIEGSERAVRLRTQGRSAARGTKPRWIEAASDFSVRILEGSTLLEIDAPSLVEADPEAFAQASLFADIDPTNTSFHYFSESLAAASEGESTERANLYDKEFLLFLRGFDIVLGRGVTSVEIDSDNCADSGEGVRVVRDSTARFAELASRIPEAQQVRLAGKLDQIRDSDGALLLLLPESGEKVRGIARQEQTEELRRFWGKPVMVSGRAHFNVAGGVQRIEVDQISPASDEDMKLWARIPKPLFRSHQPMEYRSPQGPRSGVNAIIGQWPGDESDEDIDALLEQLS